MPCEEVEGSHIEKLCSSSALFAENPILTLPRLVCYSKTILDVSYFERSKQSI